MDKTALHIKPRVEKKPMKLSKGASIEGLQITMRVLFHPLQNSCRNRESHMLKGHTVGVSDKVYLVYRKRHTQGGYSTK
jgi:hypothetical protein